MKRKALLFAVLILAGLSLAYCGTYAGSAGEDALPNGVAVFQAEDHTCVVIANGMAGGWSDIECFCPCGGCTIETDSNGDPIIPPPPPPPPPPEPPDKEKCNRGIGNDSEGCDPGNSSGQGQGEGRDAGEDRNENKKDK